MFNVFGSAFCKTLAHCGAKAKRWNPTPSQHCTFNCLFSLFTPSKKFPIGLRSTILDS